MSRLATVILGCMLVLVSNVWADTTSTSSASLGLRTQYYSSQNSEYFTDSARGTSNDLQLRWIGSRRFRKVAEFSWNLRDEWISSENWNYLNVYEAKASKKMGESSRLTLGRAKFVWTDWEAKWNQGVFQPRYMQNKLRPEYAGLIGVFADYNHQGFSARVGVLPIHIPDLGAHFYVRDGAFYSANPWFHPPAAQYEYRGATGDIRYRVNKPDAREFVSHPGAVGTVGFKSSNYAARLSAAYKPIPQVLLGFPAVKQVVISSSDDFMNLEVNPRVLYHQVYNLDQTLNLRVFRFQGSVMYEHPDPDAQRDDWVIQRVDPAFITALSVAAPIESPGPSAAEVELGSLRVQGGDANDTGEFAGDTTLFERRYQYLEAYQLSLRKPIRAMKYPLILSTRVLYDRLQKGGFIAFEMEQQIRRNWLWNFTWDGIGLVTSEKAKVEDGFLSTYRANDRLALGLQYVF